jgi:phytoene/squalene synthetase
MTEPPTTGNNASGDADSSESSLASKAGAGQVSQPHDEGGPALGLRVEVKPAIAIGSSALSNLRVVPVATPQEQSQAREFVLKYASEHVWQLLPKWGLERALRPHVAALLSFAHAARLLATTNTRTPLERERALVSLARMREMVREAAGCEVTRAELPAPVLADAEAKHAALDKRLHTAVAWALHDKQMSLDSCEAIISACEHDQRETQHRSWSDLVAFSTNFAGSIGCMLLQLHGHCATSDTSRGAAATLTRMHALCNALQLAQFWLELRTDLLERDRIYLPLADAGLTQAQLLDWVDRPNEPPIRRRMTDEMQGLTQRTRHLLSQSIELPSRVSSRRFGWLIWLMQQRCEAVLLAIETSKGVTLWKTIQTRERDDVILNARARLGCLLGTQVPKPE